MTLGVSPAPPGRRPAFNFALLRDNPAIDTGVPAPSVAADQYGVGRPWDIGAYEYDSVDLCGAFMLSSLSSANGRWSLQGAGPPIRRFRAAGVEQSCKLVGCRHERHRPDRVVPPR